MRFLPILLLVSAALAAPRPQDDNNNNNNNDNDNDNNNNNNNNNNAALVLDPANVQAASATTGQDGGGDPAQADSLTDEANFINFCTGKTITNGAQVVGGSCNGIVMGDIPDQGNMVSSIITSPEPGEDIAEDTAFTVNVRVNGLVAGSFTSNPNPLFPFFLPPRRPCWDRLTRTAVQIRRIRTTPRRRPSAAAGSSATRTSPSRSWATTRSRSRSRRTRPRSPSSRASTTPATETGTWRPPSMRACPP